MVGCVKLLQDLLSVICSHMCAVMLSDYFPLFSVGTIFSEEISWHDLQAVSRGLSSSA